MSKIVYAQGLWENVCEELKRIFPSDVYEMWFADIVCEQTIYYENYQGHEHKDNA